MNIESETMVYVFFLSIFCPSPFLRCHERLSLVVSQSPQAVVDGFGCWRKVIPFHFVIIIIIICGNVNGRRKGACSHCPPVVDSSKWSVMKR